MRTLFASGQVFDGTGSPPAGADVLVEDGRIIDVGPGLDGDEVVDCAGATVLPGLVDCHVHLLFSGVNPLKALQTPFSYPYYEAVRNMRLTLDAGITTVRDAGGTDLGVKQAVEDGLVPGPRMQIAVSMLSQTGGHGDGWYPSGCSVALVQPHPGRPDTVVDGPEEVRRVVRELVRAGADVIKVATSGGVLSARDDPRHGHFRDDEAIELMLDWGTWLVPTLSAPRVVLALAAAGVPYPDAVLAKARMVLEVHAESVRRAVDAGVTIAMGTDSGVGPHGDNLQELALLAECGMTPAQALHAATGSATELLDVAGDRGTVAPGQRADLVVVDGDALELDTLRQRIRAVYQDGHQVS